MLKKKNKQPEFRFNNGDIVKDTITGLKGMVTARTQWLNNCNTYRVQPRELKDNKPVDSSHFDEPQLKLVEKEVAEPSAKTGGPERIVEKTTE